MLSALAASRAELSERLVEKGLAVGVGATLLHVRQVRLVGLRALRRRRVLLVGVGREAAARAVPAGGDLRVDRERRTGLVPVRAPEGDHGARRALPALGLAHGTRTHP